MSQTITFNQSSYLIETDAPKPGTNELAVTNAIYKSGGVKSSSYLLQNIGNTTIAGLTLEGQNSVASGLNVQVRGINDATTPTVETSNFNFGSSNDYLVIGSSSGNSVDMGSGNDRLNVNYASVNDTFNTGLGSDAVVFGGNITNTSVNLGSDGVQDVVRLAQGATINGLVITGADNSDILFIGTTQYNYNTTDNNWINSTDPNDKKQFS